MSLMAVQQQTDLELCVLEPDCVSEGETELDIEGQLWQLCSPITPLNVR